MGHSSLGTFSFQGGLAHVVKDGKLQTTFLEKRPPFPWELHMPSVQSRVGGIPISWLQYQCQVVWHFLERTPVEPSSSIYTVAATTCAWKVFSIRHFSCHAQRHCGRVCGLCIGPLFWSPFLDGFIFLKYTSYINPHSPKLALLQT